MRRAFAEAVCRITATLADERRQPAGDGEDERKDETPLMRRQRTPTAAAAAGSAAAYHAAAAASAAAPAAAAAADSDSDLETVSCSECDGDGHSIDASLPVDEQELVARELRRKVDIRKGQFRRTRGWPRRLDGEPWDATTADNFECCWRCAKDARHGPAYRQLAVCDGICQRSFHLVCLRGSRRPDFSSDAPWFCEDCLRARFPRPKPKAKPYTPRSRRMRLPSSNSNDPCGRTFLMCAIEDHRLRDEGAAAPHQFLSYLLMHSPERVQQRLRRTINRQDTERGYTALHYALSRSFSLPNATLLQRLLDLGADPNIAATAVNDRGSTPAHFAMQRHHIYLALPILAHPEVDLKVRIRAGPTVLTVGRYANHEEHQGMWPLHMVFTTLFAYTERLISPQAGVDETYLKRQLLVKGRKEERDLREPLRFAFTRLQSPQDAPNFRIACQRLWESVAVSWPPTIGQLVEHVFAAARRQFEGRGMQSRAERIERGIREWNEWKLAFQLHSSQAGSADASVSSSGAAAAEPACAGERSSGSPVHAAHAAAAAAPSSAAAVATRAHAGSAVSHRLLPARVRASTSLSSAASAGAAAAAAPASASSRKRSGASSSPSVRDGKRARQSAIATHTPSRQHAGVFAAADGSEGDDEADAVYEHRPVAAAAAAAAAAAPAAAASRGLRMMVTPLSPFGAIGREATPVIPILPQIASSRVGGAAAPMELDLLPGEILAPVAATAPVAAAAPAVAAAAPPVVAVSAPAVYVAAAAPAVAAAAAATAAAAAGASVAAPPSVAASTAPLCVLGSPDSSLSLAALDAEEEEETLRLQREEAQLNLQRIDAQLQLQRLEAKLRIAEINKKRARAVALAQQQQQQHQQRPTNAAAAAHAATVSSMASSYRYSLAQ